MRFDGCMELHKILARSNVLRFTMTWGHKLTQLHIVCNGTSVSGRLYQRERTGAKKVATHEDRIVANGS